MWTTIITLFQNYMGTGLLFGWFFIAIIYLFIVEKDRIKRVLFLYVPIIILIIFFNPLSGKLVYTIIGEEIYYRILWLLPITIVNGYALVTLYSKVVAKWKIPYLIGCYLLIIVSGSCIYKNSHFKLAENIYHMPNAVVNICDAIKVEGREVMAVFPSELVQYVRQYEPTVCMPYGREITVERWGFDNPLFNLMEDDTIQVEELAALTKEPPFSCHYIMLAEDTELVGNLEVYDFKLFGSYDGYNIYEDSSIYKGL